MPTIRSILITREQGSFLRLAQWCKSHNIQFFQIPFIKIEAVLELDIPETDWIFFNSPKGAQSYLNHYPIRANKIAVLAEGTADVIKAAHLPIDFIGDSRNNPEIIGQNFNSLLLECSTVLLPIGNRSKRSIIDQIDPSKAREIITYNTNDQHHKAPQNIDVILFTSPSNFNSYVHSNQIPTETLVVAIGNTTGMAIRSFSSKLKLEVLTTPTESAFIKFLENKL